MYRIAICDDEKHIQQNLKHMVTEIMEERGISFTCSCYDSLKEFYKNHVENGESVHLLLLDILMNEENGMDFALKLRQENVDVGIIFITSSVDYVLRGYDVQAIKYLIKPVDREELKKAILYNYENQYKQEYLTVHQERHPVNLRVKEIVFAEIEGKKAAVFLTDQTKIVCRERLQEIYSQLPTDCFCCCHRSFLINLEHVQKIVRYQAYMSDGSAVPVSKRYFKDTQEAFMRYLAARFR